MKMNKCYVVPTQSFLFCLIMQYNLAYLHKALRIHTNAPQYISKSMLINTTTKMPINIKLQQITTVQPTTIQIQLL